MPIDNIFVDGTNWLHRLYHATHEKNKPIGDPVSVFHKQYWALRNQAAPKRMVIAFDTPGDNWRKQLVPTYKANRDEKHEHLIEYLAEGEKYLRSCDQSLEVYAVPGHEADDILATLVHTTRSQGRFRSIVFSSDKDLYSLLVDGEVIQLKTFSTEQGKVKRQVWYSCEHFVQQYMIQPPSWPHWRALAGDKSDGIAGVDGVGKEMATQLLQRFVCLEDAVAGIKALKYTGIPPKKEALIVRLWEEGELQKWVRVHTLTRNVPLPAEGRLQVA